MNQNTTSHPQNRNNLTDTAIAGALSETVSRHGLAGAEFLKGLRGVDYETGQIFDRSLRSVAQGKLNPNYYEQNLKQQAGFSAEIASVSQKNAQAIINGDYSRFLRSEDMAGYGKNHNIVDIVELMDGQEVSTSQMKFVSNYENLLKKIAKRNSGDKNDLSRYLDVDRLEMPSEQVEQAKAYCREQAKSLKQQADKARQQGDFTKADTLSQQAQNFERLESKISDSGMTTEQAIAYRLNPEWETIKDIGRVSHQAGVQGAKFGVAIGGSISLVTNIIAYKSGNKELGQAVLDTGADTLKSAGMGYSTAFTGTAIKSYMTQSTSEVVRNLSKTALPAMIVSACLATSKSIASYAKGEIDEGTLMQEMGISVTGMLSSAMFTTIGQIAIPIPVLGGLIGGMVGYALTNTFYQSFFDVLKDKNIARERRMLIEMQCNTAKILAQRYRTVLQETFEQKSIELDTQTKKLLATFNADLTADEFCQNINEFAKFLGKDLPIKNLKELDDIMLSDEPLII
ncbi:Uncharacterised protein [Moraxella lacunata]|uniref:Uncharacterized protein n=1 Tax=Moraxella lacunata TaxID=477 RepID=A0A378T816_MORLA|nr:hypothetical protein [Moraxella lacunata]STZ56013.1 Uncharacterised protein [Moraxella lacunata]